MIKNWGYSAQETYNHEWKHIRYIGRMSKAAFIRTVLEGDTYGTSWIKDRVGDTGNPIDLYLIEKYPDKVIVREDKWENLNGSDIPAFAESTILEIREKY